jgi:serine protease Do
VAGIAFITVPSFAQDKSEAKDKKDFQQIIITRTGNADEKTVIEIEGDKVTVNGKEDAKDDDVNVRVSKIKDINALRAPGAPGRTFSIDVNNEAMSLFSEDANRAMLGVITEEDSKGAQITSITKESGAEKAGLKKGDIITRVNDEKISTTGDVSKAIRKHKPGDKVTVTYLRDGKEQKATAELGKWKGIKMSTDDFRINIPEVPRTPYVFGYGGPRLGLSIQDTEDGKGVKVLDVDGDSNAAKAGIKENDIITHVNDVAVNSTDEATRNIRSVRDKASFNLKVVRNGKPQTIEVKVPRKLKTADL